MKRKEIRVKREALSQLKIVSAHEENIRRSRMSVLEKVEAQGHHRRLSSQNSLPLTTKCDDIKKIPASARQQHKSESFFEDQASPLLKKD